MTLCGKLLSDILEMSVMHLVPFQRLTKDVSIHRCLTTPFEEHIGTLVENEVGKLPRKQM